MVARVRDERDLYERAGRVGGPGSWPHRGIAWLDEHADAVGRGVAEGSRDVREVRRPAAGGG
jgi:hypothetical protein